MKYLIALALITSCSTYSEPVLNTEVPHTIHLSELNTLLAVIKPLCDQSNTWSPSTEQELAMERLNEISEYEIDISEICNL